MEDEDMKKETQNLAYPPAFKLGEAPSLSLCSVDNPSDQQNRKWHLRVRRKRANWFHFIDLITFLTFDFVNLSFADHLISSLFRGRSVRQEAQSVRRRQDLQCGAEEDFWLDEADPEARGADCQGPHEEDDGQGTQEQGHRPGPLQLVLWKVRKTTYPGIVIGSLN